MLRMTYLLLAEAVLFATLTLVLFYRAHDPSTVRVVAGVLAAVTLFACVMMLGQKQLLQPFARRVGICEMCAARK